MTFTLKLESPHFRSCCFRLCDRCALRSRATPLRDVTVRPSDGVLEERSDHLSPNKPKAQAGKRADSYDKNVHKTEAAAVCTFTFHVIAFSIIIETVLIFNIQPINISTEGIKIINIFFIYFLSSCVLSTITRFFTLSQMYHSVRTGNLCRPGVLHLSGSSPQSVFSNLRSGGRGAAQTGLSRVISNITPPSHPPFICTMWANHLRLCQEANHQESTLHRLSISGTGQTLVKGCLLSTEQDASISSHTVPVLFYSQCLEQCGQLTVHLPISSITRRLFLKGAVCTFKEHKLSLFSWLNKLSKQMDINGQHKFIPYCFVYIWQTSASSFKLCSGDPIILREQLVYSVMEKINIMLLACIIISLILLL